MKNKTLTKLTLLLAASLTVMSGATIAPSLPQMTKVFSTTPNVELLTKLVLTMPALLIAITGPFAGVLVTKIGRLKLLYSSLALYAVAGSTGYWLNDLISILIGRAFLGISVAGIMTVISTLVGDYFFGDERKQFSSIQSMFMSLGGVVFVSLGGALADVGWRLPFTLYLFSIVVIGLGLISLIEPKKQVTELENAESAFFPKGVIATVMITMIVAMIVFYMTPVQVPFLLTGLGFTSSKLSGFAISISTVGGAIGALVYSYLKKKLDYSQLFTLSFAGLATGYIIIGSVTNYEIIMVALFIGGFGVGFVLPNGTLWLLDLTPLEARGMVMGLFTSAIFLGQFLSPVVVQPLAESLNLSKSFQVIGITSAIVALVYLFLIRIWVNKNAKPEI